MKQQHDEALELEEADIFDTAVEEDHDEPARSEADSAQDQPSSEDEDVFEPSNARSLMMDIGGSNSQKSTTLNVVLESDAEGLLADGPVQPLPQHSQHWQMAASHRQRSSHVTFMAQSMPVHGSNIKMGSSVPIAILGPPRIARTAEGAPIPQQVPQTFVPPHQLSQRDEYTMAMMGESPGGILKRDRLRMRNSILQSTGYLEQASLLPGMLAGLGAVGGGEAVPFPNIRGAPGGLSQALAVGSPARL